MHRRAIFCCAFIAPLLLFLAACERAPASDGPASSRPASRGGSGAPRGGSDASRKGKPPSKLVFDQALKDLGALEWPAGATATYSFRNASPKPIGILAASASCGCSSVRLRIVKDGQVVREALERGETTGPILVVAPDERGELIIRFETRGFTAEVKDKISIISIQTDERDVETPQVGLHAEIRRAFEVNPSHAIFEPMGSKQTQSLHVDVIVLDASLRPPFQARIVSAPPGVRAEIHEDVRAGRGLIDLTVIAGPGLPKSGVSGDLVLEAKTPDAHTLTIPVTVPVAPDVFTAPRLFDFQLVEPDKKAQALPVLLQLLDPARKLQLGAARIEGEASDRLALRIEPVDDGTKYRLVLVAENGLPAAPPEKGIHGLVLLPTGIEEFPELRLEYRAYTRATTPR